MQRNDAASNIEIVAVIASIGAYLGRIYERRRGPTVQPRAAAHVYTGEQWLSVLHKASMCTMRRGLRVHTGAGWSDTMFRRRMRLFSSD